MVKKLGVFIAGGAIGAAIAYFTSPRSGFENRNLAKDAVSAVLDSANVSTEGVAVQAQSVAAQGQEFIQQAAEKTHEFYTTASSKVQEVATGSSSTAESDELRQKIEAARQRIAAQVIKNAEEAQLVDVEAQPVEVAEAEEEPAPEQAE